MTESEWLLCKDPWKMLAYLHGRASDRKLRLFAVGCCRAIWHLLADERLRMAVEVAEAHADGTAGAEALSAARDAALAAWRSVYEEATGHPPPEVVSRTVTDPSGQPGVIAFLSGESDCDVRTGPPSPQAAATSAAAAVHRATAPIRLLPSSACDLAADAAEGKWEQTSNRSTERPAQAALLRCIIGNPFKPISIAPDVLVTQGGVVVRLATAIYNDRHWDDMPLLGDALEESGCSESDVLAHCRGKGPHARGCQVLDAILGRS